MHRANYMCNWFALCVCLLPTITIAGQPHQKADAPHDVILLTNHRPLRLRLDIHILGQPHRQTWRDYLNVVHAFLDVNHDGKLDKKEWICAPNPGQLLQQLRGEDVEPAPPPDFTSVAGKDVMHITPAMFRDYYQSFGVGPIFIEYGEYQAGQKDVLSNHLFQILDKDKDGKLSHKELQATAAVVRPFDRDDNEIVTIRELVNRQYVPNPFSFAPAYPPTGKQLLYFLPTHKRSLPASLLEALQKKYDANKDGKLTRTELRLPVDLAQWLRGPMDLHVIMRLGQCPKIDATHNATDIKPYRGRRRELLLDLKTAQVKLLLGKVAKVPTSTSGKQYVRLFRQRDTDKNNVLDTKEIYRPPFDWTAVLRLADTNLDDRLSRREIEAYAKLLERGAVSCTRLTVVERPPSLFEMIDADYDGQLGLRDLYSAWPQLKRWDQNHDGFLERKELPTQYHLVVSSGRPLASTQASPPPGYGPARRLPQQILGPQWYRLMDRNKDGDVSRREFLGTAAMFQKLDRDRDELISVDEAEKAIKRK